MTFIDFNFAPAPAVSFPACTCPVNAAGPWDCCDCPEHGKEAEKELKAMHEAEIAAENAWLRAAEYDEENQAQLLRDAQFGDPYDEWFAPGYPTEMDYMNAMEANDYMNEGSDFDFFEGE